MKRFLPVVGALFLGACASDPPVAENATPGESPRYATSEEILRLQKQARENFERERQQQGGLPPVGEGPSTRVAEAPRPQSTTRIAAQVTSPGSSHRLWSLAEIRYAMQIGKSPADLTAGERAAARSE